MSVDNIENVCRRETPPANYHRFYALLKSLPGGRADDTKETLVWSFTDGRTTSLKEMSQQEYDAMCASLEERTGWRALVKRKRSLCLKLMQKAGIDTTDWQRINAFCRNPKIAGKEFAQLGVKDLDALQVKLRAIMSKGGLRPAKEKEVAMTSQQTGQGNAGTALEGKAREMTYVAVPLQGLGEA